MKPLHFALLFVLYVVLYLAFFIWFTTNLWLLSEGYYTNHVFHLPVNPLTIGISLIGTVWFGAAVMLSWDLQFHRHHSH